MKWIGFIFLLIFLACEIEQIVLQSSPESINYKFPADNSDPRFRTDPAALDLFQLTSTDSEGDFPIWALYLGDQATMASDTVILYCHGNAASMNDYWWMLQNLANLGERHQYGIMCFDYRGFGNSSGKCTQESLAADTKCAVAWLLAKGVTKDRIVFFGNSLGALPATLCMQSDPELHDNRLILEAPFPGIDAFIQSGANLSLPGSLVSDISGAKVEDLVKDLTGPLLWMHGVEDTTIPFALGESIFNNSPSQDKQSLIVNQAGHHDIIWKVGVEEYLAGVKALIED